MAAAMVRFPRVVSGRLLLRTLSPLLALHSSRHFHAAKVPQRSSESYAPRYAQPTGAARLEALNLALNLSRGSSMCVERP